MILRFGRLGGRGAGVSQSRRQKLPANSILMMTLTTREGNVGHRITRYTKSPNRDCNLLCECHAGAGGIRQAFMGNSVDDDLRIMNFTEGI